MVSCKQSEQAALQRLVGDCLNEEQLWQRAGSMDNSYSHAVLAGSVMQAVSKKSLRDLLPHNFLPLPAASDAEHRTNL